MRSTRIAVMAGAALSLAACATPEERAKSPAVATTTADLAPVPQTYERMRFVSAAEQRGPETVHRRVRAVNAPDVHVHQGDTPDPLAGLAATAVAPVATPAVAEPAPAVVVTLASVSAPSSGAPAEWSSEGMADRRPGAVVIRGGPVARGKCDAITDTRAAALATRPTLRMPTMTASVFERGGRN